jgi:hypothetical protein
MGDDDLNDKENSIHYIEAKRLCAVCKDKL